MKKTYTLAEIRNGTGFSRDAKFILVDATTLRDDYLAARAAYRAQLRKHEAGKGPVSEAEQVALELRRAEMIAAYDVMRAAQPCEEESAEKTS